MIKRFEKTASEFPFYYVLSTFVGCSFKRQKKLTRLFWETAWKSCQKREKIMVYEGINIYNIFTVCNLLVIKYNTEIYSIQSDGKSGNAELFIERLQNNAKWHCS